MAGIEVQTGELMENLEYRCLKCGKIINKKFVRPWYNGDSGMCHPVTYYSDFLEEDDTYLCGNVLAYASKRPVLAAEEKCNNSR
jgi:hypothetical protein